MARTHANLRIDIWGDQDWRDLSPLAQWLYELLLTHPKTNRAGVSEWKPGRLAKMANGLSAADIRSIADELVSRFFIVVDEETEEVVIRSYIKHDGLLKQPNTTTAMANDWAGLASPTIRAVIAFELQKLAQQEPNLGAWTNSRVRTILAADSLDAKTQPPAEPIGLPITEPIGLGSHTFTSTSTATEASLPAGDERIKETRLPKDWAPTASHMEIAKSRGVDIIAEADNFRLHAETHDRHAARWNAAFTTWLKKAKPAQRTAQTARGMTPDEMRRRREEAMSRG